VFAVCWSRRSGWNLLFCEEDGCDTRSMTSLHCPSSGGRRGGDVGMEFTLLVMSWRYSRVGIMASTSDFIGEEE